MKKILSELDYKCLAHFNIDFLSSFHRQLQEAKKRNADELISHEAHRMFGLLTHLKYFT